MKYRVLGDTGVFVSELCLGAMTFGGGSQIWDTIGGLGQTEVDALVGRSLDAGINFVDTANVYSAGVSETTVGRALHHRRHEIVLATKVRGRMSRAISRPIANTASPSTVQTTPAREPVRTTATNPVRMAAIVR